MPSLGSVCDSQTEKHLVLLPLMLVWPGKLQLATHSDKPDNSDNITRNSRKQYSAQPHMCASFYGRLGDA